MDLPLQQNRTLVPLWAHSAENFILIITMMSSETEAGSGLLRSIVDAGTRRIRLLALGLRIIRDGIIHRIIMEDVVI